VARSAEAEHVHPPAEPSQPEPLAEPKCGGITVYLSIALLECDDDAMNPSTGYLAEYNYLGTYVHQSIRERQRLLAFSLAANGLILGLLIRSSTPKTASQACFLVALGAGVTLAAELMTIRATQSIANITAYLRLFIEPHVEGLSFYTRYEQFREGRPFRGIRRKAHGAYDFVCAYLVLTAVYIPTWLLAPVQQQGKFWETAIIIALSVASLLQVIRLRRLSATGWHAAEEAWSTIRQTEQRTDGRPVIVVPSNIADPGHDRVGGYGPTPSGAVWSGRVR
jgi:hypothetical protein